MPISNRARARRYRGFTLIEIMVVVVIIGLLAAIVAPNVVRNLGTAEINRAKQDIRTLENAVQQFRIYEYRFPTEEEGFDILLGRPATGLNEDEIGQIMTRLPIDPWGNPYFYANPSEHGQQFDVWTLGADGEEGGEGTDADIGNWNLND